MYSKSKQSSLSPYSNEAHRRSHFSFLMQFCMGRDFWEWMKNVHFFYFILMEGKSH